MRLQSRELRLYLPSGGWDYSPFLLSITHDQDTTSCVERCEIRRSRSGCGDTQISHYATQQDSVNLWILGEDFILQTQFAFFIKMRTRPVIMEQHRSGTNRA